MREASKWLSVPICDDAPADADELLSSAFLEGVTFQCIQCESAIGRLFGISEGGAK